MTDAANRRILVIDDNPSIHKDFHKILGKKESAEDLDAAKAAFFGGDDTEEDDSTDRIAFELESAEQGEIGWQKLVDAKERGEPFAMAFVDIRMPPGWDGVETIVQLWKVDPDLQIVICTAFSDYSWDQMLGRLGQSDRLLILKKPFDPIEVCQLASALTEKWNVTQRELQRMEDVQRAEKEARAYASSLETVNGALETAMASATKSAELRSDFLLHLSQRVRTELTSILSSMGIFGENITQTLDEPNVEAIIDASHHLLVILDEILDMSMVDSGRMELEETTFSPLEIVDQVLESLDRLASKKNLPLEVEINGSIPESIRGDSVRLSHILRSLCHNAIRYTETGRVRVRLSVEQLTDWQSSLLRFEVVDTGIGIPQSQHGRIFELFSKPEPTSTSVAGGGGLGLAISKRLAQMLGGDVVVRSNPDQGSTFTLTVDTGPLDGVRMIRGREAGAA